MADRVVAKPSYYQKKLLNDLEVGNVLKRLEDNEYYTISKIHFEKINQNKLSKIFEMRGNGFGFLARDDVMRKIFETEYFSTFQGKKFVIYYY